MLLNTLKNMLKIAFVFIGTVLGAGFASGQEMLKFFAVYGIEGIYGLVLTGILFFIIGWAVLELIYVSKAKTYKDFIQPIVGSFFAKVLDWSVLGFMFVCFCTMLAGNGALLEQKLGWHFQIGVITMAIACFITFLYDVKGIIVVNSILAPILLLGCLMLGIYIWIFKTTDVFSNSSHFIFNIIKDNWITSSIIYVAYNSVTTIVVLTTLNSYIKNKKIALYGSLLAGFCLGLLGVCLGAITLINYNNVQGVEIPMLAIVMKYAPAIQYIYLIVIVLAMFTTAVANGYGIVAKINSRYKSSKLFIIFLICCATIIAQIGFSNMVSKVYPIFGYIGLCELIFIIGYFINYKTIKLQQLFKNAIKKGWR